MEKDLSKNYREVNLILDLLGNSYKNKVPSKMQELFNKGEDKNYFPELTIEDFYSGRYLKETKTILSILYINYWSDLEDKNKYMETLRKLDEQYNEEHKLVLNEIFPSKEKNSEKIEPNDKEKQIVETKNNGIGSLIINILDKIKGLFKKK